MSNRAPAVAAAVMSLVGLAPAAQAQPINLSYREGQIDGTTRKLELHSRGGIGKDKDKLDAALTIDRRDLPWVASRGTAADADEDALENAKTASLPPEHQAGFTAQGTFLLDVKKTDGALTVFQLSGAPFEGSIGLTGLKKEGRLIVPTKDYQAGNLASGKNLADVTDQIGGYVATLCKISRRLAAALDSFDELHYILQEGPSKNHEWRVFFKPDGLSWCERGTLSQGPIHTVPAKVSAAGLAQLAKIHKALLDYRQDTFTGDGLEPNFTVADFAGFGGTNRSFRGLRKADGTVLPANLRADLDLDFFQTALDEGLRAPLRGTVTSSFKATSFADTSFTVTAGGFGSTSQAEPLHEGLDSALVRADYRVEPQAAVALARSLERPVGAVMRLLGTPVTKDGAVVLSNPRFLTLADATTEDGLVISAGALVTLVGTKGAKVKVLLGDRPALLPKEALVSEGDAPIASQDQKNVPIVKKVGQD